MVIDIMGGLACLLLLTALKIQLSCLPINPLYIWEAYVSRLRLYHLMQQNSNFILFIECLVI